MFLFQIEDLQGQIKCLNESMGNMKVDHDSQLEKMKKEIYNELNEENNKLKVELEMIKDELSAKAKEVGFNNRYICQF